ncbi:MAG: DUF4870 domain-containing protein [Archangium sp.]
MSDDPKPAATADASFNLAGHAPTEEERIWSLVAHLSPLLGFSFLGPIIVLLVKGRESKWVRAHAIESLNFNISCFVVLMVGFVLTMVFVGFCIVVAAATANVVLGIVASVAAWQGKPYRYPATIRLIKD